MKTNIWTIASIIFLIWAVAASAVAANYYQTSQNQATTIQSLQSIVSTTTMQVNIGIDYGNGTLTWYNNTYVPIGVNVLNATYLVANVTTTPFSGEPFLTGINGVQQDPQANNYWLYSVWDNGTYFSPLIGADRQIMGNGGIALWNYTHF
jgi:hypothetical protein